MPGRWRAWLGTSEGGWASVFLALALSNGWILTVGLGTAVVAALTTGFGPDHVLSPRLLAASSVVQFTGILAIAASWTALVDRPAAALWPLGPRWGWPALLAVGCGATVGVGPGWLARWLAEHLPALDAGNLAAIQALLASDDPWVMPLMVLSVVLLAPLAEEWLFRGVLFDGITRAAGPYAAWALTTVLFALYHLDPVHVIAVSFTGGVLGALRLRSGSLLPSTVAHLVNNALATALAAGGAAGEDLPPWAVVASAAASVGLAAVVPPTTPSKTVSALHRPAHPVPSPPTEQS